MNYRFLFLSLIFLFTLATCDFSSESTSVPEQPATVEPQATPQPASPEKSRNPRQNYSILGTAGKSLGQVNLASGSPHIVFGNSEYRSRMKKGKRKYNDANGTTHIAIKYKPDGFKLRTEDGRLKWKIKHSAEKIKVSDNEENLNPYEIKPKEGQRGKLKRNGEEIGDARYREAEHKIEVSGSETEFSIPTEAFSTAWAVLLIEEIPLDERLVIIAELIARGF